MRGRGATLVLAATTLAACTTYSGVATTPTFTPARLESVAEPVSRARPALPVAPRRSRARSGASAVYQATRAATVEPTDGEMRGAAWIITDIDETRIYRVPTRLERVTTILLPEGEQINKITGGKVDGFLVEGSYAGTRPAISILPASAEADSNIVVSTTGGLYGFEITVHPQSWTPVVDVRRGEPGLVAHADVPLPRGRFEQLDRHAAEGRPMPAWAPAEAWTDAERLVVRFRRPLPLLPGLFAGQEGEQLVSYRIERTDAAIYMITSRRVTEAELRLDDEVIRLTATSHEPSMVDRPSDPPDEPR